MDSLSKSAKVSLLVLRLAMGLLMLDAGIAKLLDPKWTAAGYLTTASGPFAEIFKAMAGSRLVDILNMYGLTLVGIAIILGIAVRFSSFWGIVLMLLYYFAQFEQNVAHGYIDYHIVYALIFLVFLFIGIGKYAGLDKYVENFSLVRKYPKLKIFLG